jgi:DNA repair protein SbcD/Mre11
VPPIRLLHLADVHLGVESYGRFDPATGLNSRLLDFTARLDEAIDCAIDQQVDLVVFAGDAYKSRDPSPTQQREFARRVRRLSEAGVPTFLLVGNHDLPAASGRANSLDIFDTLAVPNVHVGRSLSTHRIETKAGPVQVVAVPWLRRSALLARPEFRMLSADQARRAIQDYAAEFIQTAAAQLDPSIPAILTCHLSVEGATYGSERSVLVGEDIVLPRSSVALPQFDYVALGHIHKHQVLAQDPPVVYPGSLERIDFGEEADQKGFMLATVGGDAPSHEFRPVSARPFVTIRVRPVSVTPTQEIVDAVEKARLDGAVVRLIVETTPEVDAFVDYAAVRRSRRTLTASLVFGATLRDPTAASTRSRGSNRSRRLTRSSGISSPRRSPPSGASGCWNTQGG